MKCSIFWKITCTILPILLSTSVLSQPTTQHVQSGQQIAQQNKSDEDSQYITVTSKGFGTTKLEALKNAWLEAVNQAVGIYMSGTTVVKDDSLTEEIASYSRGQVDSYRIISEKHDLQEWQLEIEARIKKDILKESIPVVTEQQITISDDQKSRLFSEDAKLKSQADMADAILRTLDFTDSIVYKTFGLEKAKEPESENNVLFVIHRLSIDTKVFKRHMEELSKVLEKISSKKVDITINPHKQYKLKAFSYFFDIQKDQRRLAEICKLRLNGDEKRGYPEYIITNNILSYRGVHVNGTNLSMWCKTSVEGIGEFERLVQSKHAQDGFIGESTFGLEDKPVLIVPKNKKQLTAYYFDSNELLQKVFETIINRKYKLLFTIQSNEIEYEEISSDREIQFNMIINHGGGVYNTPFCCNNQVCSGCFTYHYIEKDQYGKNKIYPTLVMFIPGFLLTDDTDPRSDPTFDPILEYAQQINLSVDEISKLNDLKATYSIEPIDYRNKE